MLRSEGCVNSRQKGLLVGRLTEKSSTTDAPTVHRLALKVRCEWALTIRSIQKSLVSVCTESTRQHTNVPEDALPRSYG